MGTSNSRLMTVKDVSVYLRVHTTTVYRTLKMGICRHSNTAELAIRRRDDCSLAVRTRARALQV